MKNRLQTFCFAFLFIAFAKTATAQGDNFDSVQIKTIKLTDKIYMLEGAGGNIGVLAGTDGIVMIDDQFAPLSEKIKAALKAISDKPVRFIINTHFHGDHVGGNENFGGEGAIIVAQDNSRMRMTGDQFIGAFNMSQKAAPYDALPKVTFTESVTLHLNGETVQVSHIKNAHTDGDAIIYFKESNVIHAGDVFVRYGLPFIDQEHGGGIDGMIKGTEELISLSNDDTKIIPGHGEVATKKDLIDYKNMLVKIRDIIVKGMKEGKTAEQIAASDPLKDYTAVFDRKLWIKLVYDSLKK